MLHIAICDDDKAAVESHKDITENCLKDCSSIGKIETYITSDNLLYDITEDKLFFDLILLDIEMPGSTGMEIAEKSIPICRMPYCLSFFFCNMAANVIFLCSWQIKNNNVTTLMILTAVFFALQSAILSVLLEWFYPIRD